MKKNPNVAVAFPNKADPSVWHISFKGSPDSVFQGGIYHIAVTLAGYPNRNPQICALHENGSFTPKANLCISGLTSGQFMTQRQTGQMITSIQFHIDLIRYCLLKKLMENHVRSASKKLCKYSCEFKFLKILLSVINNILKTCQYITLCYCINFLLTYYCYIVEIIILQNQIYPARRNELDGIANQIMYYLSRYQGELIDMYHNKTLEKDFSNVRKFVKQFKYLNVRIVNRKEARVNYFCAADYSNGLTCTAFGKYIYSNYKKNKKGKVINQGSESETESNEDPGTTIEAIATAIQSYMPEQHDRGGSWFIHQANHTLHAKECCVNSVSFKCEAYGMDHSKLFK